MNQNSNPLPQSWRWDPADYQQLGVVFSKFIATLNVFGLAVYNLLNGGLGFANLQRSLYSVTVLAGATTALKFVNPLPIAPSGVHVVQAQLVSANPTALTNPVFAGNWYFDGVNISILNVTGLTSGQSYRIVLEIM